MGKQSWGTLGWAPIFFSAEVAEVVTKLLSGKAPGVNTICPEFLESLEFVVLY